LRQIVTSSQRRDSRASATNSDEAVECRNPKLEIRDEHLRRVLENTRPSVSAEEIARLTKIYAAFVSDRSGELPVPPDAGGVGQRVSLM